MANAQYTVKAREFAIWRELQNDPRTTTSVLVEVTKASERTVRRIAASKGWKIHEPTRDEVVAAGGYLNAPEPGRTAVDRVMRDDVTPREIGNA